jgi:hypothetical protein
VLKILAELGPEGRVIVELQVRPIQVFDKGGGEGSPPAHRSAAASS